MLTRRQTLAGFASMATLGSNGTARASTINFSDPQQKLDAYVRMRNRSDGRWSFTRYAGTFFAKVEGEVTVPLMGIEGFSRGRMQKQPDGTYLYNLEEAGYHTDLETGDVLDDWVNPLNNLTVKPRHYRSGQTSIFTPDLRPAADRPVARTAWSMTVWSRPLPSSAIPPGAAKTCS